MSHQVESLAYIGETPWHKLGVKLENPPTAREAIVAAGLDWQVGLKELYTPDGDQVDHRATYRESDGKILGVVGPGYVPIQNSAAFDWFNPFLESGEVSFETAGSLAEGKKIWVLAKINRDPSVIVPGDEVQKYVLLANAHDGTLAGRVGFTPIRVVCHNTLSLAIDSDASKLLRVRHTKNAVVALEKIREVVDLANASFEATAEQYRFLASKDVQKGDLEKYVKLVFPVSVAAARIAKENPAQAIIDEANAELAGNGKTSRIFDQVNELFENGQGNKLPGVRGTYWAAYNAVTEYTTHHRGRDEQSRLKAAFADGAAINKRALTSALALAA